MDNKQYNIPVHDIIGTNKQTRNISIKFYDLMCEINQLVPVKIIQQGGSIKTFNIENHLYKIDVRRILVENQNGHEIEIRLCTPIGEYFRCGFFFINKQTKTSWLN